MKKMISLTSTVLLVLLIPAVFIKYLSDIHFNNQLGSSYVLENVFDAQYIFKLKSPAIICFKF